MDLNGDGVTSEADKYYAASPLPVAHGGWINEIGWKQFDLNVVFTYSLGRHIINNYKYSFAQPGNGPAPITGDTRILMHGLKRIIKNMIFPSYRCTRS